jgi:hypothetical protein
MKQIPRRLLALLTVAGIPMLGLFWSVAAHATFPGKNGPIAFRSGSDIYTISPRNATA